MLVSIHQKYTVFYFIGYLKGKGLLEIFEIYANLKYKYENRKFWQQGIMLV